jgi:cytochrome c oxidase subunit 1
VFNAGGLCVILAILSGGIDTGWTFYTPYSSLYSNGEVTLAIVGIFVAGLSNIFTGVNFAVTIHQLRAPGLTWFRMPLFVWSMYATSIIQILGTPVVAVTLLLVAAERIFRVGIFSPELGGDPVLFQHLFWFYSHPAVYIMVLPAMGVVSELVATFCRKRIFGYAFVAVSSLAIAFLGFLVWGHHMFISSQSTASSYVFSLFSFLIAVPSGIKVFNWIATMHKAQIRLQTPMLYGIGFIGLFTIGGMTGLFLATLGTDVYLTNTYFVVAHFHYIMVGGALSAYLGAMHYWWPKMTGRMLPEFWGKVSAVIIFLGFNLTFFPQFILGYLGMPRRYHLYNFQPDWQIYNVFSTAGSTVLAIALVMPFTYFLWSLRFGGRAPANPFGATTLEWKTSSPPPTQNFDSIPTVTTEVYDFTPMDVEEDLAALAQLERNFGAKP